MCRLHQPPGQGGQLPVLKNGSTAVPGMKSTYVEITKYVQNYGNTLYLENVLYHPYFWQNFEILNILRAMSKFRYCCCTSRTTVILLLAYTIHDKYQCVLLMAARMHTRYAWPWRHMRPFGAPRTHALHGMARRIRVLRSSQLYYNNLLNT